MQYLLTEEEYNNLISAGVKANEKQKQILQYLCTKVCDNLPVNVYWSDKPEPWGCILTKEEEWYCDKCPVEKVCPNNNKDFSK